MAGEAGFRAIDGEAEARAFERVLETELHATEQVLAALRAIGLLAATAPAHEGSEEVAEVEPALGRAAEAAGARPHLHLGRAIRVAELIVVLSLFGIGEDFVGGG